MLTIDTPCPLFPGRRLPGAYVRSREELESRRESGQFV